MQIKLTCSGQGSEKKLFRLACESQIVEVFSIQFLFVWRNNRQLDLMNTVCVFLRFPYTCVMK